MYDTIEGRFWANLQRVRGIIDVYDRITTTGSGRRTVEELDLLRAAVVFLHATTEELFRGLCEWLLPTQASPAFLRRLSFPVPGAPRGKDKITLAELHAHRGETVEDVIGRAMTHYLKMSNYNQPGELVQALKDVGLDQRAAQAVVAPVAATLTALMKRRHWIVHRADASPRSGPGHHRAQSISKGIVERWLRAVSRLGDDVLATFRPQPPVGRDTP